MSAYALTRESPHSFAETEQRLRTALAEVGFGVLTEIDVQVTLKKKLDLDVPPYRILGACNPAFGSRGLSADPELGVFLPCNVCVYERDGKIMVSAMKPTGALSLIENAEIQAISREAEALVSSAVENALAPKQTV